MMWDNKRIERTADAQTCWERLTIVYALDLRIYKRSTF